MGLLGSISGPRGATILRCQHCVHVRSSRINYHYLGDRLQVALVSNINADDDHVEGRHRQGMCLAVFHVPVSDIPDLGTSLVVVNRQDTGELDAEGIDVGAVDNVLRQVLAHVSHLALYCGPRHTPLLADRV